MISPINFQESKQKVDKKMKSGKVTYHKFFEEHSLYFASHEYETVRYHKSGLHCDITLL
jgi:hypothetical protein